jgi:hypothetical protein
MKAKDIFPRSVWFPVLVACGTLFLLPSILIVTGMTFHHGIGAPCGWLHVHEPIPIGHHHPIRITFDRGGALYHAASTAVVLAATALANWLLASTTLKPRLRHLLTALVPITWFALVAAATVCGTLSYWCVRLIAGDPYSCFR